MRRGGAVSAPRMSRAEEEQDSDSWGRWKAQGSARQGNGVQATEVVSVADDEDLVELGGYDNADYGP